MSSLCSQRDHSRKESFGRGAVKLCGEWKGDAFGIFSRRRRSSRSNATRMAASHTQKQFRQLRRLANVPSNHFHCHHLY